jgi:branched-chain amino acid transport system substrate-binding protein
MNPIRSFLSSALVATLSAWALVACGPSVGPVVKIGVAQPLSGSSAARGQDLLNGVKLAVNEINASGYKVAGKQVQFEVVAMDDKGDKDEAKKVAQAMVEQKVQAVIGHLSSDVTEVVIPIYKRGNVPQLFTSSAAELTKLGEGNAFRVVANDVLQAKAIAGYAVETLRASKVAILHEDTAFGTPMAKDVSAALVKLNKKVDLVQAVDNKTTDFAAFVAKLKAAPPDIVVAAVRDHQLLPLLAQMNAAGLSDVAVIATSVAKTQKLASGPADVKRVFLTSSSLDASEFPAGAAFLNKFRIAYKSDPVWAAHYAYDAVYVLSDVIRRAQSVDPAVLRAKLVAVDAIAPVTTTMRFGADGEQVHGAISVYERRDARWQPLVRSDNW